MNQRVPASIQPILDDYISLVNQEVPNLISAFYLEGSIALGGFNERFSDIDFIVVLNHPATSMEIASLCKIHKTVEKDHPRWKMMGSYLLSGDLDRSDYEVESRLSYHDGVLRLNKHFELNSVEGWILKNYGIAVIGLEPQDLQFTIDWDVIIHKMRENMNSYWVKWTKRPVRIVMMYSDWGIQWTVLGVLRQFYSFRENAITTKTKAGEYALTCLPTRWHRLVQEAIDIREGRKASAYQFRTARTIDAVKFLRFVIQTCNGS